VGQRATTANSAIKANASLLVAAKAPCAWETAFFSRQINSIVENAEMPVNPAKPAKTGNAGVPKVRATVKAAAPTSKTTTSTAEHVETPVPSGKNAKAGNA